MLEGSPWIEVRYNASIHAKLYVATAERDADSFALFGSGNLTTQSIESNIELGMLVYGEGPAGSFYVNFTTGQMSVFELYTKAD